MTDLIHPHCEEDDENKDIQLEDYTQREHHLMYVSDPSRCPDTLKGLLGCQHVGEISLD
jgi:hypothetical protein